MDKAQTRLRKTFKYPTDDNDDGTQRDELDEQQQDRLITSLQQSTTSTDIIYTRIFTALPLVAIVPFLWHFDTVWKGLGSVMGVISLCGTGGLTWVVPVGITARRAKVVGRGGDGGGVWEYLPFAWPEKSHTYYIYQFLPWVNLGLTLVLCLGSYVTWRSGGEGRRGEGVEGYAMLLLVPGVLFVVVSVVRQTMADVQRGVGELDGLRYGLKGA